jgi:hypothetical protein
MLNKIRSSLILIACIVFLTGCPPVYYKFANSVLVLDNITFDLLGAHPTLDNGTKSISLIATIKNNSKINSNVFALNLLLLQTKSDTFSLCLDSTIIYYKTDSSNGYYKNKIGNDTISLKQNEQKQIGLIYFGKNKYTKIKYLKSIRKEEILVKSKFSNDQIILNHGN